MFHLSYNVKAGKKTNSKNNFMSQIINLYHNLKYLYPYLGFSDDWYYDILSNGHIKRCEIVLLSSYIAL